MAEIDSMRLMMRLFFVCWLAFVGAVLVCSMLAACADVELVAEPSNGDLVRAPKFATVDWAFSCAAVICR